MRVKLPIQKIRPEQVATPRVGIGQERLIGRAVIIWARLEASLHDLIWPLRVRGWPRDEQRPKSIWLDACLRSFGRSAADRRRPRWRFAWPS